MFSASSMYNHYYGPWSSRLQDRNHGNYRGAWISRHKRRNEWLQVDFGTKARVTRIATQGRYDANQYVTWYTVTYSNDGQRFRPYKVGKTTRMFQANVERYYVNINRLLPSIKARFVRVYPQKWYGHISMRVEFYGCRLSK